MTYWTNLWLSFIVDAGRYDTVLEELCFEVERAERQGVTGSQDRYEAKRDSPVTKEDLVLQPNNISNPLNGEDNGGILSVHRSEHFDAENTRQLTMPWLDDLEPTLPTYCEPTSDFLFHLSGLFHTCIPTPLAFLSQLLGTLSILAWLFAQLPQIYKNHKLSSTSGLSIFFLVEWCLGDFSNLLGASFTHQASWQVIIGGYYVFVDLCLVGQWFWYEKLRHGRIVRRIRRWSGDVEDRWDGGADGDMASVVIEGVDATGDDSSSGSDRAAARADGKDLPKHAPKSPIGFREPAFDKGDEKTSTTPGGTTIYRVGTPSSSMPTPSPRTILLLACLLAMAQASPLKQHSPHSPDGHLDALRATPLENAGTVLSWMSSVLYLGSRLPQLYKNYRRKSTAGLSPQLFAAAFCGNLFYSSALLSNPCAWSSYPPHGEHGWVGPNGSERQQWVAAAFPFWLGAAGVLALDASVGVQFALYGEGGERIVVAEAEGSGRGRKWHWRKVSGWMRGWVPSISEGREGRETEGLIGGPAEAGRAYGAVS